TGTVKIHNVSLKASEQDISEFFSFSGEIVHVELKSCDERSQSAYITFRDNQGAERAMLLTGATIEDMAVIITPATDYKGRTIQKTLEMDENSVIMSNRYQVTRKRGEIAVIGVVYSALVQHFILQLDIILALFMFNPNLNQRSEKKPGRIPKSNFHLNALRNAKEMIKFGFSRASNEAKSIWNFVATQKESSNRTDNGKKDPRKKKRKNHQEAEEAG
ncbi:hypothetical protein ACJX0J_023956, partial [Zea mays]